MTSIRTSSEPVAERDAVVALGSSPHAATSAGTRTNAIETTRTLGSLRGSELHRDAAALAGVGGAPVLDLREEVVGELVDLVRGEERLHLGAHVALRLVRREEVVRDLVEVLQVLRAEVVELLLLEALARDRAVLLELLAERRVGRGDVEEGLPVGASALAALRRRAEERPADVGLHEPREVVVERRDLAVRARVREVDRAVDAVLPQGLARVEVPAEERVDRERHVAHERLVLG